MVIKLSVLPKSGLKTKTGSHWGTPPYNKYETERKKKNAERLDGKKKSINAASMF
jgi:hypothetical protein